MLTSACTVTVRSEQGVSTEVNCFTLRMTVDRKACLPPTAVILSVVIAPLRASLAISQGGITPRSLVESEGG